MTMKKGTGQFTTNGGADDAQYFSADNTAYAVKYNAGGYLELVEKEQEEPFDPEKDDPSQPEEKSKAPTTGITESNRTLPAVIGLISLAVMGLGALLVIRRKKQ